MPDHHPPERRRHIVPAGSLIGQKVRNVEDEDLGRLEDLVLDCDSGQIAYAVLSFGGFLGIHDKYFAIPWEAFRRHPEGEGLVLDVDRGILDNAPGFDKNDWPEFADPRWAKELHGHYGYTPYWE